VPAAFKKVHLMSLALERANQRAPLAQPELSDSLFARGKRHVLYRGDALALLGQFDAKSFDLIFADPPYFLSNGGSTCQSGKRVAVHKGEWDQSRGHEDDFAFTHAWLQACQRLLKPTGTIWVSGTQHVIFSVGYAMQQLGFKVLNTVTWFKPNAAPNLACRYFTHSTELLIWAGPGGKGKLQHTFNYKAMKAENGGKQMRDMWTMTTPKAAEKVHGKHPTQKPVALLSRIVDACTDDDALVLDPFCGSGTTGVAAVGKGRRFVGIDLDGNYLSVAQKRLGDASVATRP
jgi:site-specific DNA-methyltransferase (adenine-specific)